MPHDQDESKQFNDVTAQRFIQKSRDGTVTREIGAAVSTTITSTATPHTGIENTSQFINFANTSGHAVVLQGIKHTEPKDGGFDHLFLYVTNSDASTSFTIVNLQAGLASDEYRIFTGSAANLFFDGSASSHTQSLTVELIWNAINSRWHVVTAKPGKMPVVRVYEVAAAQALALGVYEPAEFTNVAQNTGNFGTAANTLTIPLTGLYSFHGQIGFSIPATNIELVALELRRGGVLIPGNVISCRRLGPTGNGSTPMSIDIHGIKLLKDDAITLQVFSSGGTATVVTVNISMRFEQFDADGSFP